MAPVSASISAVRDELDGVEVASNDGGVEGVRTAAGDGGTGRVSAGLSTATRGSGPGDDSVVARRGGASVASRGGALGDRSELRRGLGGGGALGTRGVGRVAVGGSGRGSGAGSGAGGCLSTIVGEGAATSGNGGRQTGTASGSTDADGSTSVAGASLSRSITERAPAVNTMRTPKTAAATRPILRMAGESHTGRGSCSDSTSVRSVLASPCSLAKSPSQLFSSSGCEGGMSMDHPQRQPPNE